VLAVALLCAVATLGLQARAGFPLQSTTSTGLFSGPLLDDLLGFIGGAGDVAAVVLLVLVFRNRRSKRGSGDPAEEGPDVPPRTKFVTMLFPLAVIAIPALLLLARLRRRHIPVELPGLGNTARSAVRHVTGGYGSDTPWPAVTGIVLAVLLVLIVVLLERRRHGAFRKSTAITAPALRTSPLRGALSAGAVALREGTDPRAAIIACYAAMEQTLARAGATPTAADTPAEVLDRAAAGGLIHSPAAGELTGLFRRARYGGHGMAEADRAAAQGALTRLRTDLGGRT
jgi:hypothetical protein